VVHGQIAPFPTGIPQGEESRKKRPSVESVAAEFRLGNRLGRRGNHLAARSAGERTVRLWVRSHLDLFAECRRFIAWTRNRSENEDVLGSQKRRWRWKQAFGTCIAERTTAGSDRNVRTKRWLGPESMPSGFVSVVGFSPTAEEELAGPRKLSIFM
jgi:hypothetical protein